MDYQNTLTWAHWHMIKTTVTDNVYTAIETTATKMPAIYRNNQILPKTVLTRTSSNSCSHEHILNRSPVSGDAVALNTSQAVLGRTAFQFPPSEIRTSSITVRRNGYPIAVTPLATYNE